MSYENDSIVISGSEDNNDDHSISDSSNDSVHTDRDYVGQRVVLVPIDTDNPWRFDSWTVDEIIDIESDFRDGYKINNKYYIGFSMRNTNENIHLLSIAVSPYSFLRYSYYDVWNYLSEFDEMHFENYFRNDPDGGLIYCRPKIHIMKLNKLPCGTYSVCIKTYWIRLVQRHWRKTLCKRNQMLHMRGSPPAVRYREIHGKYPINLRNLPGLYGMLNVYSGV